MLTYIWVNTGSGNGLLPDGSKSSPELMFTNHQWALLTFTGGQFRRNCSKYPFLIRVWRLSYFKITAASSRGKWVKGIGIKSKTLIMSWSQFHEWIFNKIPSKFSCILKNTCLITTEFFNQIWCKFHEWASPWSGPGWQSDSNNRPPFKPATQSKLATQIKHELDTHFTNSFSKWKIPKALIWQLAIRL